MSHVSLLNFSSQSASNPRDDPAVPHQTVHQWIRSVLGLTQIFRSPSLIVTASKSAQFDLDFRPQLKLNIGYNTVWSELCECI